MAVGRFMAASLLVVALLAVVGLLIQRDLATDDAIDDAQALAELTGRGIVAPALTDAALAGEPVALGRLDDVVRQRVLGESVVRVKVWSEDGTVLYSDEPRLIGTRHPLEEDDVEALRTGASAAGLSDLSAAENRYEDGYSKLLEVYTPLDTPGGQRVLYESYQPFSGVAIDGRGLWIAFIPPLIGAVLLLWLTQAPLAWSMARRLRAGQRERERLLRGTIEAADRERRRIAGDLHDGVVQDLAGAAMSLAAARSGVRSAEPAQTEAILDEGVATIRGSMRQLRDLIIEISPAGLSGSGLSTAFTDLVEPLTAAGVRTCVDVAPDLDLDPGTERLLFRGGQEALRNVQRHAGAANVDVAVARREGRVRLTVEDDGRGFLPRDRTLARRDGHVGLDLLSALVADAGGTLDIDSRPGAGTRMRLEVPCP